jgi:hypothetical protein
MKILAYASTALRPDPGSMAMLTGWMAAFGKLTSPAWQASGGPIRPNLSSRPQVSCTESA